jgi:hypothetical protein
MDEQDFAYLHRQEATAAAMVPPHRVDYLREAFALDEENSGTPDERAAVVSGRAALAQKIAATSGGRNVA